MAATTKHPPFPFYEIKFRNNRLSRAIEIIILFLLLSLITYRLFSLGSHDYIPWLLALICESWFTFVWILTVNSKWSQIQTKTYPQRLLQWLGDTKSEFPAVDMFVTTADPELEPPIITVNTVLSLLAMDYPANKLACYVSDDGASAVTFYSLVEASKFAKLWVPFCKKYNVAVRAPFRYFSASPTFPQDSSSEFQHEWKKMKDEYSKLCGKIEEASQESLPHDLTGEFSIFANIERRDHSTIIKVIWENKETLAYGGVPHLIYISREKRPKHPHHYKAGAMNVLTRVSGVITNAPFMLNVDCDCYVNDPKVILQAMCFLIGAKDEKDYGFAQFPQSFVGGLKEDPFGNQLKVIMEFLGRGISGIQGPFYQGTGCFHRRKVIYGMSPNVAHASVGKLADKDQGQTFGKSETFTISTSRILSGSLYPEIPIFSNSLDAAKEVASCGYESGTGWGQKVGWIYGSTTEDILTGLTIHSKGWKTAYCDPNPPGFIGSAPTGGPSVLTQQKRWSTGVMEILISKKSPIISTLFGKLQFRQSLAYLWVMVWPIRPIFEICYAILPAYCIINNSHFQPRLNEAAIIIPASIFIIYNLYTLYEYIKIGDTWRAWWNNQRMWKVNASAPWLFGLLSAIFKVVGFSETVFEITKKDHSSSDNDTLDKDDESNVGRFTFDDSPLFVPGTTILLVNMAALFIGFLDFKHKTHRSWSFGEVMCSVWVILMYWAFLKGLFGKGKNGIPLSTVLKSGGLALFFIHSCKIVY